jgi:hypothetical protein
VDWDGIFQGLKKHKFSGYLAIDVGMVPDIDVQYRESIEFLKKKAAQYGLYGHAVRLACSGGGNPPRSDSYLPGVTL